MKNAPTFAVEVYVRLKFKWSSKPKTRGFFIIKKYVSCDDDIKFQIKPNCIVY